MPIDEKLAGQIRERFAGLPNVEEKKMMGGLTFMYNDKMCVGIFKGDLMCRIDPEVYEKVVEEKGCRVMEFKGRIMPGFVLIDASGRNTPKQLDYWIGLALAFNKKARSSKAGSPKAGSPKSKSPKTKTSKKK
jgi:TfoX/Sxy family transcriptional regulator of competence genes